MDSDRGDSIEANVCLALIWPDLLTISARSELARAVCGSAQMRLVRQPKGTTSDALRWKTVGAAIIVKP